MRHRPSSRPPSKAAVVEGADRQIVAQAMVEGTPLLTARQALKKYGVELLKV
jgi:PIN domain nuclease of toxin-antitoxin system